MRYDFGYYVEKYVLPALVCVFLFLFALYLLALAYEVVKAVRGTP